MIPRKKLQALLYILQIFYVFGDGEPGSDGLYEQPDNIIDDITMDAKLPDVLPSYTIYNQSSNGSELIKLNCNSKQNKAFNSDNILRDDCDSNTSSDTITTTINEIIFNNVQAKSVNVSWSISGEKNATYLIYLCFNGILKEQCTTTHLNHTFINLEPCSEYTLGVRLSSLSNHSDNICNHVNSKIVNFTTSFSTPGPPRDLNIIAQEINSLYLSWKPPSNASNCVKQYKIVIDNRNQENRHAPDPECTNNTVYTFDNLYACNSYWVAISALDENGTSYETELKQSNPTLPKPHTAPVLDSSNSTSVNSTKNSVTLIWRIKDKNNDCSLISVTTFCQYNHTDGSGFKYLNGSVSEDISDKLNPDNVTITVKNLSPYTTYFCQAQSFIDNNKSSDWSLPVVVQTKEDISGPPENFEQRRSGSKLAFVWKVPNYLPGKLLNYKINLTWSPWYPVPDGCKIKREKIEKQIDPLRTMYELSEEEAFSRYIAKISAETRAGWSPETKIEFDSTIAGVPDKVTNLTYIVKRQNNNSNDLDTILSWNLPCSSRGFLSHFNISVTGTRTNHNNDTITRRINVTDGYDKNQVYSYNFGELKPLYTYEFQVFAVLYDSNTWISGELAKLVEKYPSAMPPHPEMDYIKSITLDPHKARRTTSSAAILLPLFPADNGEIRYYAVMVSGMPFSNNAASVRFNMSSDGWPNVSSWEEAMEKDFKIEYQATEPYWNPLTKYVVDYGHMKAVKFVIGEDTTCPEVSSHTKARAYCNGPLKPDTWYEVRMRAFTDMGYTDSVSFTIKTNAELNVGLVLGVVFGILFIGILTTLMLLVKRCSFRLLIQRIAQSNIPESPVPNALTRRKFINHCQQLAENPGKMSNEFQLLHTLSEDLQMPSNAACLQANRKKNRYSDILPYDFSRVKLQIIDNDPNSDYINASFIRGYSGHEEYIACQGPKEETTYDFWRMVEQYDVKIILMLTQLVERGKEKCHQYFPTIRETFNYENISIRCTSELDYRNFTQRTLLLQKEDKKRTITHLYFKEWPDHDVPDDFDAMIHFCQIFRKQFSAVKGLAVVHCSAGIGRTGTLIAIDILLQSIRDNRKLDVFGTVYRLRRNRLNMVQRESQYAYIYNCMRQVLKNPYFLKTYKPPPIDPLYPKIKLKNKRSDSSTDCIDSVDTPRKNSLTTSNDSMQPLCQSSPQTAPKIQMNVLFTGLRYCKSTGAIDIKSNSNQIGRYNSEGNAICESTSDSFSTMSNESVNDNDLKSSTSTLYENIEPLIQPSSSQSIDISDYFTNDNLEKDTSL